MTYDHTNEHETILNLMTRPFMSLTMPQSKMCGLFVFIEQLMNKAQKTEVHRERQLKIIDTLLQSGPRMNVAIHHAKEEDIQGFLQKMLTNAEQIEENPSTHQPIIQKCAQRFKEAFQALFTLLKNKISSFADAAENLWNLSEIRVFAAAFVNTLVNFSYLFYQETIGRLLKLNTHQVEGRLHHAQCLCAKAVM